MDEVKVREIEAKQLEQAARKDIEECLAAVVRAVNQARVGAIIDESEEPVRDATARLRQVLYEKAIQLKTEAAEAAFSPSAQRRRQSPAS